VTEHTLGWLGTGRMGAAMAARLLKAGHPVTVWNRTAAKAQALAEHGATVAESIAELAGRDIVFVMVSTPRDLEEVVLGEAGLLSAKRPAVIVDCSTVNAESSQKVREAVTAAGSQFLAAPVSGNPHVVADGGAVVVTSGPRETHDLVRPYLEAIGKVVVYAGDQEQARLVKLCSNLYLGLIVQSLSEVTALAEKAGVPRAAFLDFLNSTVLGSDWVRKRTPDLLALDWTPTFTTELLRKDFDLGLAAAREYEVTMPLAGSVFQLLQAAIGRGYRDADFLSLFAVEAASSGLDVQPSPASER
jgi:3-hydroxyisobutyrate dehydrogenase-like beta-hydroxyacid dehydrogenase